MPEFLEDPSVLRKEKLKSELVAYNVTLPAGEQRASRRATDHRLPPAPTTMGPQTSPSMRSAIPPQSSLPRAAVGRVRAPGPGHKGGCLAVVAPRSALAVLPPWRCLGPRRQRDWTRALCHAGLQATGGEGPGEESPGFGAAGLASGLSVPGRREVGVRVGRRARGGLGVAGPAAAMVFGRGPPSPFRKLLGRVSPKVLRVTFERFPAFLTAVTGNRVSQRSLEGNLCILISKPKFEINSRLFMLKKTGVSHWTQ